MKEHSLKIEYLDVKNVVQNVNNVRLHSASQVQAISKSIKEFGFCNPLLIDGKNVVIAGHGRLMAAKKLKMEKIPCVRLSGLSAKQISGLMLADNKLALDSEWDIDGLKKELEKLADDDFDISVLGFDPKEFDRITAVDFSEFSTKKHEKETPADVVNIKGNMVEKRESEKSLGDSVIYFSITPAEMVTVKGAMEKLKLNEKELFLELCSRLITVNCS